MKRFGIWGRAVRGERFFLGGPGEALRSQKVVLNKALGRWKSGSASLFEIRRALPAGQKDFPTAEKEGSVSIGRREEALRWFWNHRWPQLESLFKAKAGSASAKLEGGSASSWEKRFFDGLKGESFDWRKRFGIWEITTSPDLTGGLEGKRFVSRGEKNRKRFGVWEIVIGPGPKGSASLFETRKALRSQKVVLNKALGRWKSGSASSGAG